MANLTEERVREIVREEVKKALTVDIHEVAQKLLDLQKRTARR